MKNRNIAYWVCQLVGWGAYSAFGIAMAVVYGGPLYVPKVVVGYLVFFAIVIFLTHRLRHEIKQRQWLTLPIRKAAPRLIGASILVAMISTFQVVGLEVLESRKMWNRDALFALAANLTVACLVWTLFYVAITITRHALEMRLRLREAELKALEAQVNPHFLFNCLNTIRGMIVEDAAVAQDMVTRLANILRYNLQRERSSTVPLEREIEIVADYLAIESIRFDDRLRVRFEIQPAAAQAQVPSMLVQTLVENAVKHGIGTRSEGGEIVIRALIQNGALTMEVVNSGQLSARCEGGTQIGLTNARERLRLLYGEQATLKLENRDAANVAALVSIPA
jgi:LytS/YehU family sensor histidine kinase